MYNAIYAVGQCDHCQNTERQLCTSSSIQYVGQVRIAALVKIKADNIHYYKIQQLLVMFIQSQRGQQIGISKDKVRLVHSLFPLGVKSEANVEVP